MKIAELFLHDLRAPLSRARTYAKLLLEERGENELLTELLRALEDLDARLREEESKSGEIR
jgi:signal transduction histidine kinase